MHDNRKVLNKLLFYVGWWKLNAWRTTGSWPPASPSSRLALLWTITSLRLLAVFLLLRWLGIRFWEVFTGRFGMKELLISVLIVIVFLGLEVAYSGTYTPQSLGEFRHFLKLSEEIFLLHSCSLPLSMHITSPR